MKKPVVLIIMDGWGYNPKQEGNAVALGKTPNLDYYKRITHILWLVAVAWTLVFLKVRWGILR